MRTPSRSLTAAAAAAVIVATAILAAASGTAAATSTSAATKTNAAPTACRDIEQLAVPGAERLESACLGDLTTTGTVATGHTDSSSFTGLRRPQRPRHRQARRLSLASSSTATSPTPRPSTPRTAGTTTPSS